MSTHAGRGLPRPCTGSARRAHSCRRPHQGQRAGPVCRHAEGLRARRGRAASRCCNGRAVAGAYLPATLSAVLLAFLSSGGKWGQGGGLEGSLQPHDSACECPHSSGSLPSFPLVSSLPPTLPACDAPFPWVPLCYQPRFPARGGQLCVLLLRGGSIKGCTFKQLGTFDWIPYSRTPRWCLAAWKGVGQVGRCVVGGAFSPSRWQMYVVVRWLSWQWWS